MNKKIKKLLWIIPAVCIISVVLFFLAVPCLEKTGEKYIIQKLAGSKQWQLKARKVKLTLLAKQKNLYISSLTGEKIRQENQESRISFHAENISIPLRDFFFIKGFFPLNEIKVEKFSFQMEKEGKKIRQEIRDIHIKNLAPGANMDISFFMALPVAGEKSPHGFFPVTGKGNIFFNNAFQVEKFFLTIQGREEPESSFTFSFSAQNLKKDHWNIHSFLSARKLQSGDFFTFLQIPQWQKESFFLDSLLLTFSAVHKGKSDLFLKTLSGDLKVKTGKITLPATLFSGNEEDNYISSTLAFIQIILQNLLSTGKKNLQNREETKGEMNPLKWNIWNKFQSYQEKTLLMKDVLAGKEPIIISSSQLHLVCKNAVCRIAECEIDANMPEKTFIQGEFILPSTAIRELKMDYCILDLVIPVYFNGGTLQNPRTDETRSLRENWKRNKDFFFSSGIKNLQQLAGKYIPIDGKLLSELPENEAVKKVQKKVERKLEKFFKRLGKRIKKKERSKKEE